MTLQKQVRTKIDCYFSKAPRDEDEDDSADDLEVGQAQDGGGDQLQVKG